MAGGSLYKRGGVWWCQIYNGAVENGKRSRLRFSTGCKLKMQARAFLTDYLARQQMVDSGEDCSLDDLYQSWLEQARGRYSNDKTLFDFSKQLEKCLSALKDLGVSFVSGVDSDVMNRVVSVWLNESASHNTINKRVNRLKSLIDYGVDLGVVPGNPLARFKSLPPLPVKQRAALTKEECSLLLSQSSGVAHAMWAVFLYCGLRSSELSNLPWSNVDLKKNVLRVAPFGGSSVKTQSSIRAIPLRSELVSVLSALPRKSEYVFTSAICKPFRSERILFMFKAAMRRALCAIHGVPFGKRMGKEFKQKHFIQYQRVADRLKVLDVHSLRYTFATNLIACGADVKTTQYLLGHSSPNVTLKIYAQFSPGNSQNAVNLISDFGI